MTSNINAKLLSSKNYWESYALCSLEACGFPASFVKCDKPDLQDHVNGVGIEVVQSMSSEEGIFRYMWNSSIGIGLTSNEFAERLSNPHLKARVVRDMPGMVAITSGDANDLIIEILDTIEKKSALFANYTKFNKNGLYLFSHYLLPEQMENLMKVVSEKRYPFDFYIINLMNKIYVLNMNEKTVKAYNISREELQQIKSKAAAMCIK